MATRTNKRSTSRGSSKKQDDKNKRTTTRTANTRTTRSTKSNRASSTRQAGKTGAKGTTAKRASGGRASAGRTTSTSRARSTTGRTQGRNRAGAGRGGSTQRTTEHDEIRRWVEERGGFPATVRNTASDDEAGILRIDFPGYSGKQSLERISWDEFFDKFEEARLAFLYQDKLRSGQPSRFARFVARNQEGE